MALERRKRRGVLTEVPQEGAFRGIGTQRKRKIQDKREAGAIRLPLPFAQSRYLPISSLNSSWVEGGV